MSGETDPSKTDLSKLSDEQLAKMVFQHYRGRAALDQMAENSGFGPSTKTVVLPWDIRWELQRRGYTIKEDLGKGDGSPPPAPTAPPTPPPPADGAMAARPPARKESTGFPLLDETLDTLMDLQPIVAELNESSFDGLRAGAKGIVIITRHARKALAPPTP